MTEPIPYNIQNPSWVYVLENKATGEFEIDFDLNLPAKMEQFDNDAVKLVYSRRFDNILDGIGHKLLLENISKRSLKRIINSQQ